MVKLLVTTAVLTIFVLAGCAVDEAVVDVESATPAEPPVDATETTSADVATAPPVSPTEEQTEAAQEDDLPFAYGSIIASETNCRALQEIFEQAEQTGDHRREVGDLEMARQFTRVMDAADARMREVGCYDE